MPSVHCVYEPCIVDKTTPFSRELCHKVIDAVRALRVRTVHRG